MILIYFACTHGMAISHLLKTYLKNSLPIIWDEKGYKPSFTPWDKLRYDEVKFQSLLNKKTWPFSPFRAWCLRMTKWKLQRLHELSSSHILSVSSRTVKLQHRQVLQIPWFLFDTGGLQKCKISKLTLKLVKMVGVCYYASSIHACLLVQWKLCHLTCPQNWNKRSLKVPTSLAQLTLSKHQLTAVIQTLTTYKMYKPSHLYCQFYLCRASEYI